MSAEVEAAENRGYSKGYAAGTRRQRRDITKEHVAALREDFIQRMMIAIAPQVISSPWGRTVDGAWKADKGATQIMNTVRNIAEQSVARCDFHVIAARATGEQP